jgi:hypothetical protein
MVVSIRPTSGVNDIRLISAWRPAGSQTILWAQDMATNTLLHLVQWGDKVYLPVTTGLRLGIGVYNGSGVWRGYPTYVEAMNLHDGGPSSPNDCTSSDMWEAKPGMGFVMDALKNRGHRTGRPLVIVPNGLGMGIGEATYGTDEYRGQIRVYERSADPRTTPHAQPTSPSPGFGGGYGTRGGGPESFGDYAEEATRSAGPASYGSKGVPRGGYTTRGGPEIGADHQVGIGAGAEEERAGYETGVRYNRDSRLVAALCVESRTDLSEVLCAARHENVSWYWTPNGPRWYTTWTPSAMPVAPHITVAPGPHRPFGTNRSGHAY